MALAQPCYQWIRRTDVGAPGQRAGMAMAYDTHRNVTVFFGGDIYGTDDDSFFNDTWEYDGVRWRMIETEGRPFPRTDAAFGYDEVAREMLLVGGNDHDGDRKDIWSYQSTGPGTGRWTFRGDLPPGQLPAERSAATLTFDESLQRLVLIGGHVIIEDGFLGLDEAMYVHQEVRIWEHGSWRGYHGGGLGVLGFKPADFEVGRTGLSWHAAAYDPFRANIFVYGGVIGCAFENSCDPADNSENPYHFVLRPSGIQIAASPNPFFGKQQAEMVYDRDRQRFVVVGGFNWAVQRPSIEMYDLIPVANDRYAFQGIVGGPQEKRTRHGLVYDRARKRVVLYGGMIGEPRLDDTWELVTTPVGIWQSPPAAVTNCAGTAVSITAYVDLPPAGYPVDLQWLKDGVAIPGANGTELKFAAVEKADEGNYVLRIVNQCGVATNTTPTRLVVHDKPTIQVFDALRKNRCPGDSIELSVVAISTLPIRYQWFKNGAPMAGANLGFLRLSELKHEDTGDYHVEVSNDCGTTPSAKTHLQVGVTILGQPLNATAPVCGTAGFAVVADGVGRLRYQWRLDRAPVRNDVYFAGGTTAALSIQPALYAHEGKYDVIITDDCGAAHSVTSRVATLTITPGPQWFFRTTNGPPGRFDHAMVYDSNRGVTVMFGGVQIPEYQKWESLGDLWEWDGARWLQRVAHSTNEGWMKTPTTPWQPSLKDRPVHRFGHMMAYDSSRGRVVLFGGETRAPDGSQIYLRDLWEWDGAGWHLRAMNGPSPRADAGMTYDVGRKRTILYGGQFSAGIMEARGAVWEWDGEEWHTNETVFVSSYSQSAGGMVYDSFRQTVVYGPMQENTTSGRFWDWDGTRWILRTSETFDPEYFFNFSGNENGAFAFDGYRRRTVWFGGRRGVVDNKTGFFDGEDWTSLTTSPILPAARSETAMAYDSRRRAVVMFGGDLMGYSPNPFVIQMTNDTWELIALDTPLINEQPASQYRRPGETARFTVSAVGPKTLSYRWLRDGVPLITSSRIIGADSGTLTISSVEAADAGTYRAVVLNDCGESWSSPAILTLQPDLQIFSAEKTITLLWTDTGVRLEVAEGVAGPWTPVAGATSPFRPAQFGPAKFFRIRTIAP